jgi:citrate synthase
MTSESSDYLRTWIGSSDPDHITIAGRDLASEVMGKMTLTELAYLLVTHREPTAGERRVVDAVLVALADHGLTPSALSARLTYTGAPEAIQGAVAAGLLGAGSVFLGPAGDTAQFLDELIRAHGFDPTTGEEALSRAAREAVGARRESGRRIPGLGHPLHKHQDPRTARLYAVAREEGVLGPQLALLEHIAAASEELSGRHLPINGAGAGGAALADTGVPVRGIRAFVLIARTAGLVAHLVEESAQPIGMPLYDEVEHRASGLRD